MLIVFFHVGLYLVQLGPYEGSERYGMLSMTMITLSILLSMVLQTKK